MRLRMIGRSSLFIGTFLVLLFFIVCIPKYERMRKAEKYLRASIEKLNLEEYAEAEMNVRQALGLSSDNAYYLECEGLAYERMLSSKIAPPSLLSDFPDLSDRDREYVTDSISFYNKALKLNPHDDIAYHNLGWLYCYLKNWSIARDNFREGVNIEPTVALYHVSSGLLLERLHQLDEAYGEYSLAVQLSPDILDSKFFDDLQKRSPSGADRVVMQSASYLEDQLRKGSNPILEAKLGKLYLDREPEKAREILNSALTQLPSLSRAWYNLGLYDERFGDKEAKQDYDRAALLDPYDFVAWYQLGEYYYSNGKTEESLRCYRQAVGNWLNRPSVNAMRAFRVYKTKVVIPNNAIPKQLLSYCDPIFDVTAVCWKIAGLYKRMGNKDAAQQFEDLGRRFKQ